MRLRAEYRHVYQPGKPPRLEGWPHCPSGAWTWLVFFWAGHVLDAPPHVPEPDEMAVRIAKVRELIGYKRPAPDPSLELYRELMAGLPR